MIRRFVDWSIRRFVDSSHHRSVASSLRRSGAFWGRKWYQKSTEINEKSSKRLQNRAPNRLKNNKKPKNRPRGVPEGQKVRFLNVPRVFLAKNVSPGGQNGPPKRPKNQENRYQKSTFFSRGSRRPFWSVWGSKMR